MVAFGRRVRTGWNRTYEFYSMFGVFNKQGILVPLKGAAPKRT